MRYKIASCFLILLFAFSAVSAKQEYVNTLDPALQYSIQGMTVYENAHDTLMNNAVNSYTPGYKQIGVANISDKKGVRNVVYYRFIQGTAIQTGGSLDFIIEGPGFFVLRCPWGKGFTRDGRFTLDSSGRLVSQNSQFPVLGENGEIYLPKGTVSVNDKGTLFVGKDIIDDIKIVNFSSPERLKSVNGSIFYFEDPMDEQRTLSNIPYTIKKGYYESSNVNITEQMAQLPVIKNVYDANTKAIKLILKSLNAGISIGNPQ